MARVRENGLPRLPEPGFWAQDHPEGDAQQITVFKFYAGAFIPVINKTSRPAAFRSSYKRPATSMVWTSLTAMGTSRIWNGVRAWER